MAFRAHNFPPAANVHGVAGGNQTERATVTEQELTLFCLQRATELIVNNGQTNVAYDQVVGVVTVDYQIEDADFAICNRIWILVGQAIVSVQFPA